MRFRRNLAVIVGVSIVATAAAVLCQRLDWLGVSGSEAGAYDSGLTAFTGSPWFPWGRAQRSDRVVILAVDDKTFDAVKKNESYRQRFGSWPYARQIWAIVVGHLLDEGAKAVVFDMTMDEAHSDPAGDALFAQELSARNGPVYLGFNMRAGVAAPAKIEEPKNALPGSGQAPPPGRPAAPATAAKDEEFPAEDPPAKAPAAAAPAKEEEFPSDDPPKAVAKAPAKEEEFPSDDPPAKAPVADVQEAADAAPAAGHPERRRGAEDDPEALKVAEALAFPIAATGGLELTPLPTVQLTDEAGQSVGEPLPVYPISPLPELLGAAAGFGLVVPEQDDDGKIRRTRFGYTDGVNTYATLTVSAVADLWKAAKVEIAPGVLTIGDHQIPINRDGSAEIDYGGSLEARFRSISLVNVLDDVAYKRANQPRKPQLRGAFKDKVVLIAGYALGTSDIKATPFSNNVPGGVKQAAELDNLLAGRFIVEAPFWVSVVLAFLVALFSVMVITVFKSTWVDLGYPLALYFGFFLLTGAFLVLTRIHVLSAMPNLAGTFASIGAVAFNHLFAKKDRELLKKLFDSYMDEHLVEQMIESPELPQLDGQSLDVTAFVSRLEGFVAISARHKDTPGALMKLLNTYLSRITPVLQKQHGCIDKYVGDQVVCLFGAPLPREQHPMDGCRAALALQAEVARLHEETKHQEGAPTLRACVGLNSDVMLVGNVGSEQLLDYTAIGEGMDLAQRLEAANAHYGTAILMGEKTWQRVKDQVEAREVDTFRHDGLVATAYELLALKGGLAANQRALLDLYAKALAAYRSRSFADALARLDEALKIDPQDGPSKALRLRCQACAGQPATQEFEAVTTL